MPPAGADEGEATLDELLAGPTAHDPVNQAISTEELRALIACLSTVLSELESRVLGLYLDGHSYQEIGERLGCEAKTVDNALQRVKRKVGHAPRFAGRAGVGARTRPGAAATGAALRSRRCPRWPSWCWRSCCS